MAKDDVKVNGNGAHSVPDPINPLNLPKLPIPPLKDVLDRYLNRLKPLQTPAEHRQTEKVVQQFLKPGGEGEALHQKLIDYAKDKASFIEEWWDAAYLDVEDPVVLNLNPFFLLEDDPTPARGSQLMRATSLILASLGFIHDLRTGVLPPDNFRGVPLDMYQYTRLFGTARLPTKTGCIMTNDPEASHVIVLRRGQFYYFDALDSQNRPILTERTLQSILQAIITDADSHSLSSASATSLGVLSTENRKVWAGLREKLVHSETNRKSLEIVDKALFVVCLDEVEPKGTAELCENLLCGTSKVENGVQVGSCMNRWYDKLQIIVAANGAAGINFEHSHVDGHTVLRFVADVYTDLILRFAKSINPSSSTLFKAKLSPHAPLGPNNSNLSLHTEEEDFDITPRKLDWHLGTELRLGIRFAESRISDLICQNEVRALEFEGFGKNFITRHGFSPDAFVQMGFQAAYFLLYGRTECTYEPAMVKTFLHGRTEAIRTVSMESVEFVETYCSGDTPRNKVNALRKACKAHVDLTKMCAKGQGQDRILYAMYCLANKSIASAKRAKHGKKDSISSVSSDGTLSPFSEDSESDSEDQGIPKLPMLFRDSGYSTLNHTTISTSNCGNPALRLFGFGPVVQDGFGIGYIIKDESLSICASSKHLQTQRLLDTLQNYFLEIQNLIIELYLEANQRKSTTFIDHRHGLVDARTGERVKESSDQTSLHHTITVQSVQDEGPGGNEELYGGYDFFGTGDVQEAIVNRKKALRRGRSVGVRLALADY